MVNDDEEPLKLPDAVKYVFEECRMVLPGIQALFGFQMIAVFNQGFGEKLTAAEQKLHGVSILLVIAAIALVMSPAAVHRKAEPKSASDRFLLVASRFLLAAMLVLSIALSLDVYVVTKIVWKSSTFAVIASAVSFVFIVLLWEAYPVVFRKGERKG